MQQPTTMLHPSQCSIKRTASFWDEDAVDSDYDFTHKKLRSGVPTRGPQDECRDDVQYYSRGGTQSKEARCPCSTPLVHVGEAHQQFWKALYGNACHTPPARASIMLEPLPAMPLPPRTHRHQVICSNLLVDTLPLLPSLDQLGGPNISSVATSSSTEEEYEGENQDSYESLALLKLSAKNNVHAQEHSSTDLATALGAMRLKHAQKPILVINVEEPKKNDSASLHELNSMYKRVSFKASTAMRPVAKDGLTPKQELQARRKSIQIARAA